jgi:hypothetical protein
MITIGITTCNRMKYTKSLLKSLGDDILFSNQIIIVDNGSKEPGFKDFLKKESKRIGAIYFCRSEKERNWINDEYIAKNIIIENAKNKDILFLQDDQQYLFDKETLDHIASCFSALDIPSLDLNAVRTSTIRGNFSSSRIEIQKNNVKEIFWLRSNNHFQTMGFFKKDVFDKCGLYPTDWPLENSYWGRSETWYANKIKEYNSKYLNHQIYNVKSHVPLFAPVWNDPRGGYAFIRGEKRCGHYIDPVSEKYYKNYSFNDYLNFIKEDSRILYSFPEIVKPDGWSYNINREGDQIKFPQSKVMIDGPFEDLGS